MTVLLLNADYRPLTVLPVPHAVSMMLRGVVDSASDEARAICTPNTVFELPQVLRLKKYINVPKRGVHWSRRGVLARDDYTCIFCGVKPGSVQKNRVLTRSDMTVDHLHPKSRGGRNTWGNTACACPSCNHRKGAKTPSEAGMKLKWEPKTPRVDYLIVSGSVPTSWKLYLET